LFFEAGVQKRMSPKPSQQPAGLAPATPYLWVLSILSVHASKSVVEISWQRLVRFLDFVTLGALFAGRAQNVDGANASIMFTFLFLEWRTEIVGFLDNMVGDLRIVIAFDLWPS
jgi:hypothetical protein